MKNIIKNIVNAKKEKTTQKLPMPSHVKNGFRRYCVTVLALALCSTLVLPASATGGDPLTVMDQVRDTKNTEDGWMDHITLQNAFRALNDREKQILSLRFYDGKTQMEVASALGISQAQVSRLEKGAIGARRQSVSVS